jgi:hypothetical protein
MLILFAGNPDDTGTPTDWEVAREAVAEMFTDLEGLDGVTEAVLTDTRYSTDDAGYMVRGELARELKERGIEVFISSPLMGGPEVEVRYLVNELRVVHKRSYRKLLLGRKMIERWVQADVEITVVNDNKVLSQKRYTNQTKTAFPESELDLVRSPTLTEEHYTTSSAGSLWEPLVVTAAVATLIWLFYAPTQ